MKKLVELQSFWAIERGALERLKATAQQVLAGELDVASLEARLSAQGKRAGERAGDVAVLYLGGVLTRHLNIFSVLFGGTSTAELERDFRAAMDSPEIAGILLLVNSPGGSVDGTVELASVIHQARGQKPIVALVDSTAASAALWIASGADKLLMRSPTAMTGSIGVVATHFDFSRREEAGGLKVTEVVSSPRKNLISPHQPLSDEGRDALQAQVDFVHQRFVSDLARNRRVSPERAALWGTGEMFFAEQAIRLGLADGFGTVETVVAQLAGGSALPGGKGSALPAAAKVLPAKAASEPAKPAPAKTMWRRLLDDREVILPSAQPATPETKQTEEVSMREQTGGRQAVSGAFAKRAELEEVEKVARVEWEADGALRAQFSSLAAYVAFRKAEARGQVRIFSGGPVVKGERPVRPPQDAA